MNAQQVMTYVGAVVTVASILANFVPPHTIAGKVLHWVALNIRVQTPQPPAPTPPPST